METNKKKEKRPRPIRTELDLSNIAGIEGLDTSKARYLLSKLTSEKKEEGNKEESKK